MCSSTFYEYFTNIFYPWLIEIKVQLPVLFFLDGHGSHLTTHLSEFCTKNGIEVIALYPNSTHIVQPMDVAVFRPLKVFWKKQVNRWKTEHPGQQVTKTTFTPILKSALNDITKECFSNGFRAAGIFPYGPEYIDFGKLNSKNRAAEIAESQLAVSSKTVTFFQTLEAEIVKIFTDQKLDLFKQCFFLSRSDLENQLPTEDIGLFTLWAKYKHMYHIEVPAKSRLEETEQQNTTEYTHTYSQSCTPAASQSTSTATHPGSEIIMNDLPQMPFSGIAEVLAVNMPTDDNTATMSYTISPTLFELEVPEPISTTVLPGNDIPPTPAESEGAESSVMSKNISLPASDIASVNLQPIRTSGKPKDSISAISYYKSNQHDTLSLVASNVQSEKNEFTKETDKREDISPDAFITESEQLELTKSLDLVKDSIPAASSADLLSPSNSRVDPATKYCTPIKSTLNDTLGIAVPSPFKRSLFWPDIEDKKKNRKKKEKLPSASYQYGMEAVSRKKEAGKRRLQEEKEKRAKERFEKRMLKLIMTKENKIRNTLKGKSKVFQQYSSSDDTDLEIEYAESGESEGDDDSDSVVENIGREKHFTTTKRTQKLASYKGVHVKRHKRNLLQDQNSGSDQENVHIYYFCYLFFVHCWTFITEDSLLMGVHK